MNDSQGMTYYEYHKTLPNKIRHTILVRKVKNHIKLDGWEYDVDSACLALSNSSKSKNNHNETTSNSSGFEVLIVIFVIVMILGIYDSITEKVIKQKQRLWKIKKQHQKRF